MTIHNRIHRTAAIHYLRILFVLAIGLSLVCTMSSNRQPHLSVTLTDADTGQQTPARIKLIETTHNRAFVPEEAVKLIYGFGFVRGYDYLPDSSFYADGSLEIDLEPGTYRIKISKGIEYVEQTDAFELAQGKSLSRTYRLNRWINMPEKGWYSSDGHIHLRRSPRENPLIKNIWGQEHLQEHLGSGLAI